MSLDKLLSDDSKEGAYLRQEYLLKQFKRDNKTDAASLLRIILELTITESNTRNLILCLQLLESLVTDPHGVLYNTEEVTAAITRHISHVSNEVRQQSLQCLLFLIQQLESSLPSIHRTAVKATLDPDTIVLYRALHLTAESARGVEQARSAKVLVSFLRHPDRRVRATSLSGLQTLIEAGCGGLGSEAHQYGVDALSDDCQEVRLQALELLFCLSNVSGEELVQAQAGERYCRIKLQLYPTIPHILWS